ncbi:hypothetical protein, partial [Sulfitobacter dubius]|uniref:hypothetical protein n=1 Tax=Sulfitobacter dubius TaxID=218673 RepID=UPI0022B02D9E
RAEPCLVLLQDANNLFFAETASLHLLSPQLENRLTSNRGHFRGAGHCFYPSMAFTVTNRMQLAVSN